MNPSVSATAIGSFAPDSAASTDASLRRRVVKRSVANTAAASVGADDRAEQQRLARREVEDRNGRGRDDPRGDEHAERAEHDRRRDDRAEVAPPGREAALEQDRDQADDADRARKARVVELDAAGPLRPEQHPEPEERDQERETQPPRADRRDDGEDEHAPGDEDLLVGHPPGRPQPAERRHVAVGGVPVVVLLDHAPVGSKRRSEQPASVCSPSSFTTVAHHCTTARSPSTSGSAKRGSADSSSEKAQATYSARRPRLAERRRPERRSPSA